MGHMGGGIFTQGTTPGPSRAWPGPNAETIELYLHGAAGRQAFLTGIGSEYPTLVIDGTRVKRTFGSGVVMVPTADGSQQKLHAYAVVPGVLTVKFMDQVIYRTPTSRARPLAKRLGWWGLSLAISVVAYLVQRH